MAGTDITADVSALVGCLVPFSQVSPAGLWESESSFSENSPVPGDPTPLSGTRSALGLRAVGSQSANGHLNARVHRGGHPVRENGAGIVFKNEADASNRYRGGDPPRLIYGWESLDWFNSGAGARYPHVRRSPTTGTAVAAYQVRTGPNRVVRIRRKEQEGAWSSSNDIYTFPVAPLNHGYHPCVLALPDGSFLVYFWIEENGSTAAQIRAYQSQDDGATWSVAERFVLDESIDISGSPGAGASGYDLGRIRAAYANGQVLLLAYLLAHDTTPTYRDRYVQYASDSEGLRFERIEADETGTIGPFGAFEVLGIDDSFLLLYTGGTNATSPSPETLYRTSFESAFQPFSETSPDEIPTSYDHAEWASGSGYLTTELAGWVDENGILFMVYGLILASGSGGHQGQTGISRSRDRGETWEAMGASSAGSVAFGLWHNGDGNNYLAEVTGCAHEGRGLVVSSWETSSGTYDPSVGVFYLGGYSTVTMPGQSLFELDTSRVGYEVNYVGIDTPGSTGWTVIVGGGSPTYGVVHPGGGYGISTSSETVNVTRSPSGTVDGGIIFRAAFDVSFGGSAGSSSSCASGFKIRLADGTDDRRIEVHVSTGAFSLHDGSTGAELGSTVTGQDFTGGVEFKVGMNNGTVSVWYRDYTARDHDKEWILSHDALSVSNNGSPASTNLVEWGNVDVGTADTRWYEVHFVTDDGVTTGKYIGPTGLADGLTNPVDLFPIDLTSEPRYLVDGVSVFATDGPGRRGDEFDIVARSQYGHERIFPTVEPTPRRGWRSIGTAAQYFAFAMNPELGSPGIEDSDMGGDLLALFLSGVNWRTGEIEVYISGSGWTNLISFDLSQGLNGLPWVRRGNRVRPASSGSFTNNPYLFAGEYTGGGYFELDASGPFPIGRHGAGLWSSETAQHPRLMLDGITPSIPNVGTAGRIWPSSAVVLFSPLGSPFAGIRLKVDSQSTYEGNLRIGSMAIGTVVVSGPPPSHGWRRSTEPGIAVEEARDRTARARLLAPSRRTYQFGWPETVFDGDVLGFGGVPPRPDYLRAAQHTGNEPVGSWGDAPYTVEGLIKLLEQSVSPVVWLPQVPKWGPPNGYRVLNRPRDFIYGWYDGVVDVDHVFGVPGENGNLLRVGRIAIREQP